MIPLPFSRGAMVIGAPVSSDESASKEQRISDTEEAMSAAYARAAAILAKR